jgi:hypothetical protein
VSWASPWTEAELRTIIQEARRFVRARTKKTELEFALEVGEHLFKKLLLGRIELVRSTAPWKTRALERIAKDPRVRISEAKLRACIHTYLMAEKLGKDHPKLQVPTFSIWKWDRMWELYDDPDNLLVVLEWVAEQKVPKSLVSALVQLAGPYVDEGGRMQDLLFGTATTGETPYKRLKRLGGIERKWLVRGQLLSDRSRQEALRLIDGMLAVLDS